MQKLLPINCASCGRSFYGGNELKSGREVEIQIGRCLDGDNKYDCYVLYTDNGQSADTCLGEFFEIQTYLQSRFMIERLKTSPVCFQQPSSCKLLKINSLQLLGC